MKLALTAEEIDYLNNFLDDGKSWDRPLNHPHRTLLEKWLAIQDEAKKTGSFTFLSTEEDK